MTAEAFVAINTSDEHWTGSEPNDIRDYLQAVTEGPVIGLFRLAACSCGGVEFAVEADDDEGGVRRTCTACGADRLLLDTAEVWDEAEPFAIGCVCDARTFNLGVGFVLRRGGKNIAWVYVGLRCTRCGGLGCCADWKISYLPSMHLLDQV